MRKQLMTGVETTVWRLAFAAAIAVPDLYWTPQGDDGLNDAARALEARTRAHRAVRLLEGPSAKMSVEEMAADALEKLPILVSEDVIELITRILRSVNPQASAMTAVGVVLSAAIDAGIPKNALEHAVSVLLHGNDPNAAGDAPS